MEGLAQLGTKVRALRQREQLTQKQLAQRLDVSASYLNLIEHNRRPLSAALLIKLTQIFQVDLASFAAEDDDHAISDLMEAFADPLFDRQGLTSADVKELATTAPNVAAAVLRLYRAYRAAQGSVQNLSLQFSDDTVPPPMPLPTEAVSDFLQRQMNYFPELESAAEDIWREARLDRNDMYRGLVRYLESVHGVIVRVVEVSGMHGAVRRFVPERRLLMLSEVLAPRSRNFQLAHQICLLNLHAVLDRISEDPILGTDDARRLARVALANYFASALIMPYVHFHEAAQAVRYDIELLGHRFRAGFEQVCHRLTTLRRPGAEGIPFHFLRVDIAGNISKRFSASGIHFARFAGICPRWGVFQAFLTPGMLRPQVSRMPDGGVFFCVSRTLPKSAGGYHHRPSSQAITIGCDIKHARKLVYTDGMNLENFDTAVPVGVTCRLCPRMDCEQRAMPPIQHPLAIDEDVRGLSFYAPADEPSALD